LSPFAKGEVQRTGGFFYLVFQILRLAFARHLLLKGGHNRINALNFLCQKVWSGVNAFIPLQDTMTITGTLAPYMSKGNYSPNEKIVLEHFFTNTDKNVYCARNMLSSQFRAFLVGQYSRTHVSLRDRFLQLFEDQKKALEK
jgi:hypothetical protein